MLLREKPVCFWLKRPGLNLISPHFTPGKWFGVLLQESRQRLFAATVSTDSGTNVFLQHLFAKMSALRRCPAKTCVLHLCTNTHTSPSPPPGHVVSPSLHLHVLTSRASPGTFQSLLVLETRRTVSGWTNTSSFLRTTISLSPPPQPQNGCQEHVEDERAALHGWWEKTRSCPADEGLGPHPQSCLPGGLSAPFSSEPSSIAKIWKQPRCLRIMDG